MALDYWLLTLQTVGLNTVYSALFTYSMEQIPS